MKLSRIDIIGLNGGDGLHYDKPPCFLTTPNSEDKKVLKCDLCAFYRECLDEYGRYSLTD